LVRHGVERGFIGLLVVRSEMDLASEGQEVLARLSMSVESDAQEREWPGTRTLKPQRVLRFRLTDLTGRILIDAVHGLHGWRQPSRPEDLCFIDGAAPWLTSIAHESAAWIDCSADERARLTLPSLAAVSNEQFRAAIT
jgi:hypothetical protein